MSSLTASERMAIIRHKGRPTIRDYIPLLFDEFCELHGDRQFGDDHAILGGIANFRGTAVTVIAQVKGRNLEENKDSNFAMPHPEGYRKALRLAKQAEKFHRPVICFIDKTPVISIVLGEGGSGGAIALGVCDELAMLENAIYSVISPRGFASILWRDASREKEAADRMRITAEDLRELGVCDRVIAEPAGGAHNNPQQTAENISHYLTETLTKIMEKEVAILLDSRYNKFRKIGEFEEFPKGSE